MMRSKSKLLAVADAFAKARELSISRVSTIVFTDGKVLDRLRGGKRISTDRFDDAMRWFSDNWPDDTAWPEGVERPAPQPEAAE